MKRALITGITGQDGSYLAEHLLAQGYEVHGLKRRSSSFNTGRIEHIYQDPRQKNDSNFFLHYGDLLDASNLLRVIAKIRPDEIYNLAAQSHVQVSFETPEYTANADGLGVLRLLEAIRILGLTEKTKLYQASTSEIFGGIDRSSLNEDSEIVPMSPYGAAKAYAHWMVKIYRDAYGIFAANGILFNHESPRRGETFVTQKIIKSLVKITKEEKGILYLGNIYAERDWGHARDYVEAMHLILGQSSPSDFVIATGNSYTVKDFIGIVCDRLEIPIAWEGNKENEVGYIRTSGRVIIRIDPSHYRPLEVNFLKGDASKARELLGWRPKISINELVDEMVSVEEQVYCEPR